MATTSQDKNQRIIYIDIARFYAMAAVFFGHFAERVMLLGDPTAATFYKFIYSFHMVLFFILSGFISKASSNPSSVWQYFKHRFFSRLVPFLFFTLVFMGLAAIFPGDFIFLKLPTIDGYLTGIEWTFKGVPLFCVPSWFLLMLFSVEMIHFLHLKAYQNAKSFMGSDLKILTTILAFYIVGYYLNLYGDFMNLAENRMYNFLFIHEAVTMYAFYLLGAYLRSKHLMIGETNKAWVAAGVAVTFLLVLFTFRLNQGPFNFNYHDSVVIMMAAHGHIFWFPFTAIAGSLLVFCLGQLTPHWQPVVWMGRNTLILMCLNGVFYHYINPWASQWVFDTFPNQPVMLFLACALITVISLALCAPFIYLLNKYLPQLVGKPKVEGPWLKPWVHV